MHRWRRRSASSRAGGDQPCGACGLSWPAEEEAEQVGMPWDMRLAAQLAALAATVPDHSTVALLAEVHTAHELLPAYRTELSKSSEIRTDQLLFGLEDHRPVIEAMKALRLAMVYTSAFIQNIYEVRGGEVSIAGPGTGVEHQLRRHLAEMHGAAAALLGALSVP